MSEREELVKRLRKMRVTPRISMSTPDSLLIDDTIAALTAQPQGEPTLDDPENYSCPSCGRNYTAPPSGGREWMLRAAEICEKLRNEFPSDTPEQWAVRGMAVDCRDAITRAAESLTSNAPSADAWAVRNNQGYWVGIWNDKETAEKICAAGQPSHGQVVVPVMVLPTNLPQSLTSNAEEKKNG